MKILYVDVDASPQRIKIHVLNVVVLKRILYLNYCLITKTFQKELTSHGRSQK